MKVFSTTFSLSSEEQTEVSDVTKLVQEAIQQCPVTTGIALVDDLKAMIERLVPERAGYRHDDPRYSDCERGNAHSHLRAALRGRTVAVGIGNGGLALGRFQSVIFAELDGPRRREITVQVLGD